MIDGGKRNVLGICIDTVDYEGALARIMDCARGRDKCTVTALAVHGLTTGALDRRHRFRLNRFDLAVPDGQPVRWALNLLYGTELKDRVYGPKLTILTCMEAARLGMPVYFYGSRQDVLDRLCQRMRVLCPELIIAGSMPSLFRRLSSEERESILQDIRTSGAQILFAGLGCPRQEVFAYEMSRHLNMPILAVGAAFDYYAGLLREPPALIQRAGLQWLYRLAQEPRRLWRRYLVTNTQFVILLLSQLLRLWSPDPSNSDPPTEELLYG
jgi:exopolysaccharide biosynthesis WecB/TagA/CpsF family protein